MKLCRDIMTPDPARCIPSDTVDRVARAMDILDIGAVPVIDDERSARVIGMITDRDMVLRVVGRGLDPRTVRVADVMSDEIATCELDEDLSTAIDRMLDARVRRIPVVDEDGVLWGMISQADLATRLDDPFRLADFMEGISHGLVPTLV